MSVTSEKLFKWIPLVACAIVAIIGMISGFIQGGISQYNTFRNWFTAALNFSFLVAALVMVRVHFRRISSRMTGWESSITFMLFFVVSLILGAVLTVVHPTYLTYFDLAYNAGTFGLLGTMGIFLIPMLFRAFLLRRRFAYYLAFVFIITMFTTTAAGDFLNPTLTVIGRFVFDTFGANGEAGYNIARYMPEIAVLVAIVLGKERGRPI